MNINWITSPSFGFSLNIISLKMIYSSKKIGAIFKLLCLSEKLSEMLVSFTQTPLFAMGNLSSKTDYF